MTTEKFIKSCKLNWIIYRSSIIAIIVMLIYAKIDLDYSIIPNDLFSTSITTLSILFGFNMVVVTHYFSNSNFNNFLKQINSFNSFKRRYKRIIKILIISLIVIYIISIFENVDYCFFGLMSFKQISSYIVVFLSILNLVKAYDCVVEFFNVYGTTYSNTVKNMNNE
jgi:L-cystine uptake protein TcyP (sodium:dicarboxylate symporter family)